MNADDRFAVEDVIVRYATAMDSRDWDLFRSCFVPDAHISFDRFGEFTGRDALVERLAPRLEIFEVLQHFVSNFVIADDDAVVTARTNFVSHHVPKQGGPYTHGGTFDFELVRTTEGWQITSHVVRLLWTAGDETASVVGAQWVEQSAGERG
jgi:3-phenylpropionate/cinnamic acid dioxygenase small subunit